MMSGRSGCRWISRISVFTAALPSTASRSEEHTSELQSQSNLVCRLLLEKKKKKAHVTIYVARIDQKQHALYWTTIHVHYVLDQLHIDQPSYSTVQPMGMPLECLVVDHLG